MVLSNVVAEIEVDGKSVRNHISIRLDQRFNEHHNFYIRLPFSVLEQGFTLSNIKNLLGKITIIRLKRGNEKTIVNEFKGIITDVGIEQVNSSHSQIILKGSSPTIILESGEHTISYVDKSLKKICEDATKDAAGECNLKINPGFETQITYLTQYKESNFEFLNRLSAEFGQQFYYNGKDLIFGIPQIEGSVEMILGEDVTSLQLKMELLPLSFKTFRFNASEDKIFTVSTPSKLNLGTLSTHAVNESDKLFGIATRPHVHPKPQTLQDLNLFMENEKLQKAGQLEVISGKSTNPEIVLGTEATILISKKDGQDFTKSEQGKFTITSVYHEISENGKYSNTFEGVPVEVLVIPVRNFKRPVAETQLGIVKSNNDPDNLNRVKVQLLWHEKNITTEFINIMSPDAGAGGKTGKNRGFVFIPEVGDKVHVAFRFNDPDLPFVMGSVFLGKAAGGGGKDNKIKTISTNKGSIIKFDDSSGSIHVSDAGGNSILLNGGGLISVNSAEKIELKCGESTITLKKDGNIEMTGGLNITLTAGQNIQFTGSAKVELTAGSDVAITGGTAVDLTAGTQFSANAGTNLTLDASVNLSAKANANLELEGSAHSKFASTGIAEISAPLVKIN